MEFKKTKKQLVVSLLAFTILFVNILVAPEVKAIEPEETKINELDIVYVKYTKDNANSEYTVDKAYELSAAHKAPEYIKEEKVVENYIFGGWFKAIDFNHDNWKEARENSIKSTEEIKGLDTVYAKFVPAYVLSMKAQNDTEKVDANGKGSTTMRIVSSVDSLEYYRVGFTIYVNNRDDQCEEPITKYVYETMSVGTKENGDYVEYTPKQVFGKASQYFIAWNYRNIPTAGYNKVIYVQPYWITYDGTKVIGLSKYLRVEDGRNGYINIPINLRSEEEGIAAAYMSLDYSDIAENYELLDVTKGRVFHEVQYDKNGNKIRNMVFGEIDSEKLVTSQGSSLVNMVFNSEDVTKDMSAFDLYACVRFKKKSNINPAEEIVIGENNFITFEVENEAVAGSDEITNTDFSAWPILY